MGDSVHYLAKEVADKLTLSTYTYKDADVSGA